MMIVHGKWYYWLYEPEIFIVFLRNDNRKKISFSRDLIANKVTKMVMLMSSHHIILLCSVNECDLDLDIQFNPPEHMI